VKIGEYLAKIRTIHSATFLEHCVALGYWNLSIATSSVVGQYLVWSS